MPTGASLAAEDLSSSTDEMIKAEVPAGEADGVTEADES
jgi:hypothetical protein